MDEQPGFEFIAGSIALCFVDTYGDRGGDGVERLTALAALEAWLAAAALVPRKPASVSREHLRGAVALREAIYRCGLQAMAGKPLPLRDVEIINAASRVPPLRPQLDDSELFMVASRPVGGAFSVIAADALRLFGSPQRERIRQCPGCSMMFVDTSRPGRRLWCSSARGCGNRAKVRNLRARRARVEKGNKN